jgi:hypothetical protein
MELQLQQPPPKKYLQFQSSSQQSLGMKMALAWYREQMLEARKWWDLWNATQIQKGLILMTPVVLQSCELYA